MWLGMVVAALVRWSDRQDKFARNLWSWRGVLEGIRGSLDC